MSEENQFLVYPIHHPDLSPTIVHSNELRAYMKTHSLCDVTAFLPLWISCHGWVHGLNIMKSKPPNRSDPNWLDTIYFQDELVCKPHQKLSQEVVESLLNNQFKQRLLVLKLLNRVVSDNFQQMQVLATQSDTPNPYNNDYDLVRGYDTYCRLWRNYHLKWDQQQRVEVSRGKAIINQLAFPPKSLRWHTALDKTKYVPRDKWDKKLILNDFYATLRPTTHIKLDDMDIFDLPLSSELSETDTILLAEIDALMDFFPIPSHTPVNHSTLVQEDLIYEDPLPDLAKLLSNLDLQRKEIDSIAARFGETGIDFTEVLDTVFDIKQHDRDLLLNRVLMFADTHITQIAKLDSKSKQIVNGFVIDLVALFSHLRVRQVPVPPQQPWVEVDQSVAQLETIIQNKIHLDLRALESLQQTNCVDINRFQTSPIVHQLIKAYDLYIVNTGFIVKQFHQSAQILSNIIHRIAQRKTDDPINCPEILKYIITRHPGRGNLLQLQQQKPIIPGGVSGAAVAGVDPDVPVKKRPRLTSNRESVLMDTDQGANSRPATFDLLTDSDITST